MLDLLYPKRSNQKILAEGRIFKLESIDLEFSNGKKCTYERCVSRASRSILVIPLIDENTVLLIREYAAGTHRYELGFPKGVIEKGEDPCQAANREMKEEVGYGARKLTYLKEMTAIPGYLEGSAACVLAEDLYSEALEGDEPEPLEVIPWPLSKTKELVAREDFTEARSIAALLLLQGRFFR